MTPKDIVRARAEAAHQTRIALGELCKSRPLTKAEWAAYEEASDTFGECLRWLSNHLKSQPKPGGAR